MSASPLRSIYQIKVTLQDVSLPIWRRVQIDSTSSLEDCHSALQIAMGWENNHLHEFVKDGVRYGVPDEEFSNNTEDEQDFRLQQLLKVEKDSLIYLYDFGDGWEHVVELEKILPFSIETKLPECIDGSRMGPPEDVGGPPGYEMFVEAIADKSHPNHAEIIEWIGEDFDVDFFNVVEINEMFDEYFK